MLYCVVVFNVAMFVINTPLSMVYVCQAALALLNDQCGLSFHPYIIYWMILRVCISTVDLLYIVLYGVMELWSYGVMVFCAMERDGLLRLPRYLNDVHIDFVFVCRTPHLT